MFTAAKKQDFELIFIPTLNEGTIGMASMILDTIPLFDEQGALLIREHFSDSFQLISCKTDDDQSLWLGNSLFMIDCIDRAKSKADYYPTNYPIHHLSDCVKTAFTLSLTKHAVAGFSVFRAIGDPLKLVATNNFLNLFEGKGLARGVSPKYIIT
ncbi:MAG: hypothetical protein J0M26_27485 [Planctomycetes bacterium]|nr:hypothetical protein [Planctomycetota bacterium]